MSAEQGPSGPRDEFLARTERLEVAVRENLRRALEAAVSLRSHLSPTADGRYVSLVVTKTEEALLWVNAKKVLT